MSEQAKCELCGEPMPEGETMFKFHGYSGPCPKPPLERKPRFTIEHITTGDATNYRITDNLNGVYNRVATCYDESNAKLVCDLMNKGAAK